MKQEVYVILHEAPCIQLNVAFIESIAHGFPKLATISIVFENYLLSNASCRDMVDIGFALDSTSARHDKSLLGMLLMFWSGALSLACMCQLALSPLTHVPMGTGPTGTLGRAYQTGAPNSDWISERMTELRESTVTGSSARNLRPSDCSTNSAT